jgi:hypothetical protein
LAFLNIVKFLMKMLEILLEFFFFGAANE